MGDSFESIGQNRIESLLVSGDSKRIFINTAIGCKAGCKYCYLRNVGIDDVVKKFDKSIILDEIKKREEKKLFVNGPKGTIVSFGCFTECWDEEVKTLTMDILKFFIEKGNYIQIASKKSFQEKEIKVLGEMLKYPNQVTINVSLPVYGQAAKIEPYAEWTERRIENFSYNKKYNIDTVLYIKPVLENITIKDLDVYIDLITKYELKVVVGELLETQKNEDTRYQIIGEKKMWPKSSEQQKYIVSKLSEITRVYENSTDVVEEYRRMKTYDIFNRIAIKRDNRRVSIVFAGFVCWEGNGEKIVEIQTSLEDEKIDTINLEFNDVVWMDGLILCQLCLYLKKAFDSNKKIDIYLFDRDNMEHARFVNYLMDAGFITFFDSMLPEFQNEAKNYISRLDKVKLKEGDFDSAETILSFRVIEKEQEMEPLIEETMRMLKDRNLEGNTVLFRLKLFLQEVIGNVYEHAYNEGETPYCGILIRRKYQKVEREVKFREYEDNLALEGKINFNNYRSFIFSKNKYKVKKLDDIRADYIQVHVVDIGKGILAGMKDVKPQDEYNVFSEIFLHGNRMNRKNKNTEAGGLYMIRNIFASNADALGIKGDYHLYPIECEKEDLGNVDKNILYLDNYKQKQIIKGFSVVGYMSVIGDITKQYRRYFRSGDKSTIHQIYKNHQSIQLDKTTKVVDYRFDRNENYKFDDEIQNVIILVGREFSKNRLAKLLYDNFSIGGTREVKNIIIADFVDYEVSKYYLIFDKMKIRAQKVILISRSFSASVYTKDNQENEMRICHNQDETKKYFGSLVKHRNVFDSIYIYVQWLIGYESRIFWIFLNEYQQRANQKLYLKEKIEWNYENNKYMRRYLDFSQASFIRECRELFILQLFRLISLFGTKIYFESGDRFAEDICELANAELGVSAENTHVLVGSAYVTGTSSLKQNVEEKELDDRWFYFFRHIDCESEREIATLLEWENAVENVTEDAMASYKRIEETPFIAKRGTDFFRDRTLKNKDNRIIKRSSQRMYEYLQDTNVWLDKICGVAHVDLVGPHDNILFDLVEVLKKDRMDSYTQPKALDTSYDFLLFHFYDALGRNKKLRLEDSMDIDFRTEIISYKATKSKILKFSKKNPHYFENEKGILLYFTDYATTKIIGYYQEIFSDELNYRIIPISLINRERGAASLLISPLLVESLEELLKEYKNEGNNPRVTIFSSMLISTKLIDELKHMMYRIGAVEVRLLSLLDRRRMPFGYFEKDEIITFWKLDIPPLGNSKNCALCQGLANLELLKKELGIKDFSDRISEISSLWRCKRSFENKVSIIKRKYIYIPEEIVTVIKNEVVSPKYMENIELTTDIGLVLFAIEDTAVSRSFIVLEKSLASDLSDETKILLLCVYLGLFRKVEISEKKRFELSVNLYELLKKQELINEYTSLAVIILAAQEEKILSALKRSVANDIEIQSNYTNVDSLVCGIFVNWYKSKDSNKKIQYYFKATNATLPEMLNAIFQYTCRRCRTTHSGILTRIYEEGRNFIRRDYIEARYHVSYLQNIYDRFQVDLINDLSQGEKLLNEIKEKAQELVTNLREYIDSENEDLYTKILANNRAFIDGAEELNCLMFKTSSDNLIQNDLEQIKAKIIAEEKNAEFVNTLNDILIEWPTKNDEHEYWYYWTSDIVAEISYLMLDLRYLKEKMKYSDPKTYEKKEVPAVVEPIFTDSILEIHFKNKISSTDCVKTIETTKRIKYNRPSISRMRELIKENCNTELFDYKKEEENGESFLDVCIKIPYIYKRENGDKK